MNRQQEFERVALIHAEALLRTALRISPDRAAAEDLVQEALLRAWKSFGQFEPGTNAKAWLFRIMLNVSNRRWSDAQKSPRLEALDEAGNEPAIQPEPMSDAHVLAGLAELPEEFRVVLMLAAVEGFTCKEISQMLDLPIGTVMSRLSRARQNLRKRLYEMSHGPEKGAAAAPGKIAAAGSEHDATGPRASARAARGGGHGTIGGGLIQ